MTWNKLLRRGAATLFVLLTMLSCTVSYRFNGASINYDKVKTISISNFENRITGYDVYNKSVAADGYSAQVELRLTINVRFVNNTNHAEDFEQKFTASQTYDSTLQLTSVQDGLLEDMTKDIVDQIFNATVANW